MSIIRLPNGVEATFSSGKWVSSNKGVEDLLNIVCTSNLTFGYIPNMDLFLAEKAARLSGGAVVSVNKVEFVSGRIY